MSDFTTYETNLQVREGLEGDGYTVEGILVPWDVVTHGASDARGRVFSEVFRKGSFAKTIQEAGRNVVLRPVHGAPAVGKAVSLEERAEGLWGRFRVSDVQAGNEMLTLIRDGVTAELSIEFVPVKSTTATSGVVERKEVILRGVAATPHPAYSGARVLAVREFSADDPETAPNLTKAKLALTQLRAKTL